jgi:hypothetical protein
MSDQARRSSNGRWPLEPLRSTFVNVDELCTAGAIKVFIMLYKVYRGGPHRYGAYMYAHAHNAQNKGGCGRKPIF